MASKQLSLVVRPRGKPIKNLPEETALTSSSPASDLYAQLASQSKSSVDRLRITKGSDGSLIPNSKTVTIADTGLRDRSAISVKDLGPQIAWRTVFLVEYLGPILIHPFIYALRSYLYPNPAKPFSFPPPSQLQTLTMYLVLTHFVKRELETLFLHKFSSSTMPLFNIFKNSTHYWLLAGLNIAVFAYAPRASIASDTLSSHPAITYTGLALFTVGELLNLQTHITLSALRPASDPTVRGIPNGIGFGLVTCPNYMYELLAWTGVCLVSRSWASVLFTVVAGAQMGVWAKKKEKRYRSEFGDKYKRKRFSMIPGVW
ncbi:3-oxo-5-alpha-steroid 4-dehydrogenase family protein-like protein [Aulographum hederae CBS 113979]|uniref:very-long-chain enoyl-CoA reductase n=1 Tax=Aulographum hederae CBS 113979 TaxID=1176131 RepID=A0A6G1HES5_9PEZI|nr:3-oxo-5-alpha-steroid 4-dehydrogenase family protein-like protein [Aulographum hederae CBS 113979]